MTDLQARHCVPCEGGVKPLETAEVQKLLEALPGWQLGADAAHIEKRFIFKNFYHTMAFVNALAFIANQENHHPDLELGYNYCVVKYMTHAIHGLSDNDFICAAKIEQLQAGN